MLVAPGDLRRGVLAVFHGRHADRHVPAPWRGGVDQVEVLGLAHADEVPVALGVSGRLGLPGLDGRLLGPLDAPGADVACGLQLHALDPQQIPHVGRPLPADADKAHADGLHGRRGHGRFGPRAEAQRCAPRPAAAHPRGGRTKPRQARQSQQVPAVHPPRRFGMLVRIGHDLFLTYGLSGMPAPLNYACRRSNNNCPPGSEEVKSVHPRTSVARVGSSVR